MRSATSSRPSPQRSVGMSSKRCAASTKRLTSAPTRTGSCPVRHDGAATSRSLAADGIRCEDRCMAEIEAAEQSPIPASNTAGPVDRPDGAPARREPEATSMQDGVLGRLARFLVETDGVAPTVDEAVAHALTAVPCDWAVGAVTYPAAGRSPRFYT